MNGREVNLGIPARLETGPGTIHQRKLYSKKVNGSYVWLLSSSVRILVTLEKGPVPASFTAATLKVWFV